MKSTELRIGNLVYDVSDRVEIIESVFSGTLKVFVHSLSKETLSEVLLSDIKPIPLTEEWLLRMKDNDNKTAFPDWIKYVHEAQNWYYWNNNKTELKITL